MRLLVWFLIGIVIYLAYGHRHSKLHHGLMGKTTDPQ